MASERDNRLLRRVAVAVGGASTGMALAAVGYLLVMVRAAREHSRLPPADVNGPVRHLHLTALVPAHDEELGIASAVSGLLACDYPKERLRVIVVADNCTDATAAIASAAGAEVWERDEPELRGKGAALSWAMRHLDAEADTTDAVVFLDADCVPTPNLLAAVNARLAGGADAAQARVIISNPSASDAAALRWAGSSLMNFTRPLGKSRLGLSCGLNGTGMAMTVNTLSEVPWATFSLSEDREYHLHLVTAGKLVEYVHEAEVRTEAPASRAGADMQETRWDAGNVQIIRAWVPRLLRDRSAENRRARVHAALDLLAPPQSAITGYWGLGLLVAVLGRSRPLAALSLAAAVGQTAYVLLGLRVAGAPPEVWGALARSPGFVARRIVQLIRLLVRPPATWERTHRGP